MIGTIWAERLAYLPSAGLAALAVGLLGGLALEVPRPSRLPWKETLLAAAVLAYGAATAVRNRAWKDDRTLYADMVAKEPGSAKAHYNVAWDAQTRGDRETTIRHLTRAVEIFPRYYDAWALLGKQRWDEKKWDEAIGCYRRSVQIFPTYENGHWGLAKVLEAAGRTEEAGKEFDEGARLLPDSYPIAFHRAAFLEAQGRLEDAEDAWDDAVENGDGAPTARLAHARVLVRLGRESEAWDEARWALVERPFERRGAALPRRALRGRRQDARGGRRARARRPLESGGRGVGGGPSRVRRPRAVGTAPGAHARARDPARRPAPGRPPREGARGLRLSQRRFGIPRRRTTSAKRGSFLSGSKPCSTSR